MSDKVDTCRACGAEMVFDDHLKLMVHKEGGNIYCVYGKFERGNPPKDIKKTPRFS